MRCFSSEINLPKSINSLELMLDAKIFSWSFAYWCNLHASSIPSTSLANQVAIRQMVCVLHLVKCGFNFICTCDMYGGFVVC
ncbi:hypothetical protein RIF29_20665 [Crotalaria pallida]|uniref:Uncharacterized protein n=1 Tax=Crotalaria pallida TaxID=3830 RepID=A0AAN9I598_CROPI